MTKTVATVYTDTFGGQAGVAQLVVVDGPDAGRACRLDAPRVVGTDGGADLVLADRRVSHAHLRVSPSEGGFEAEDLKSRNGTFYEGARFERGTLPLGATLKLGHTLVRIAPVARPLDIEPSRARSFEELVGPSLLMREVFAVLELAAQSDATVLLEGETGTGKELAARALHDASARRGGPFVAIDVSALPRELVESELFGHTKGAFTGATSARRGAFVRAHGGTLLLDELGTVSAAVQARLLRVLEERRVRALGADHETPIDVRVIGASRDDLDARVADGRFRSDLFYRLAVLRVRLPPLRERREDVWPIAEAMLRRRGIDPVGLPDDARAALFAHDWPGNVRELRNVIDRALALSPGASSAAELRGLDPGAAPPRDPLIVHPGLPWSEAKQRVIDAFERRYLGALLQECEGNLSEASRRSGLDRKQLRTLAKKHGLL